VIQESITRWIVDQLLVDILCLTISISQGERA